MTTRDTNLYEICTACGGSGVIAGPISVVHAGGRAVWYRDYPCPACTPLRVVRVGVTAAQLGRLVAAELVGKGGRR